MIKSAVEFKKIGDTLSEHRRARNLNIEEVSKVTRIRQNYLEALEQGDYGVFPSEVYLKGFLKNYAKYLGIDHEKALAMYRRESEVKAQTPSIDTNYRVKTSSLRLNLTFGRVVASIIIAVVIGVALYIGTNIATVFKKPSLQLTAPVSISSGSEGSTESDADTIIVDGRIDTGSVLTINSQKLETNNFERFTTELALNEGVNRFLFEATSQFGQKTSLTLIVFRNRSTLTTPTPGITETPAAFDVQIEIQNRNAFVTIEVDDQLVNNKVLNVGEKLNLEPNQKLSITSPRPDAIKITINGRDETLTTSLEEIWQLVDGEVIKQ